MKFTYQPIQEVVIHEIVQADYDTFIQRAANAKAALRWVDGILFIAGVYMPTPETVHEAIQNKIHWASIEFCFVDDFAPFIEHGMTKLSVINCTSNSLYTSFAKWLKNESHWKIKKDSPVA